MDTLERLLAIEEIKQLKSQYFHCLDHKDWARWKAEIFAPDAKMIVAETGLDLVGIDTIIEAVSAVLKDVKTIHHGHMPLIEILSETEAKGQWAMEDVLWFPPGRRKEFEGRVHGYGHYHEHYKKGASGWRIASLKLTRLHMGVMP